MCTDSSKGDIDLPTGKVAQFKRVTQTGLQQILQIVIFWQLLVETHSSHEVYTVSIFMQQILKNHDIFAYIAH